MKIKSDQPRRSYLGPRLIAVALLAFGLFALYASFQIRQAGGYAPVGPRFFPLFVAAGLLALGALLLLRATALPDEQLGTQAAAEEASTHWPTVGLTAAALLIYALALGTLGYLLATSIFFPAVARILGSRRLMRDIIAGLVLSVAIYFGFTRLLGVRLPAGLLDFIS
jgi:putative tricarboxylic transport membrane protein